MAIQLGFDIETMTPAKKKLLLVLPPLIVIALFLVLLIMPLLEERRVLSAEVEKQNNEIQIAQRSAAKLPALMAENERLQSKLLELQIRLPEEREVSRLLRQVSEQGRKAGLQVILWRPGEKKVHVSGEVYEIPVDVEMKGGYHKFGRFFSKLTRFDRVVNISNINMRMAQQEENQRGVTDLTVSFAAITYSLIPEEERKEMEKAAKEIAK
jgi:type IV pilus assembly protein PilO